MKTYSEPRQVVVSRLHPEARPKLERMAAEEERTISALVRKAVEEFLERKGTT